MPGRDSATRAVPLVILSLYWKRMTRNGAMAGIIGGEITVLVWKQLEGGLFDLYEIIPGFLISTLLIILFSRLDKKPTHEETALFDLAGASVSNDK